MRLFFFSFLRVGSQAPNVICMYVYIFLIMEKNIPLPDNIMYLEPVEKQMLGDRGERCEMMYNTKLGFTTII